MKQGIFIAVLVLAICVLAGSLYVVSADKKALHEQLHNTKQQLQTITAEKEQLETVTTLNVTGEEIQFVEQVFQLYLNYDNETYVTRFQDLSNYVELDVLNKLKGAASLEPPVIAMKNEVEDVQVYMSATSPHTFLVYTTTNYFLDNVLVNHGSQLYEVEVLKDNGQYIIGEVKVLGNMTEVDGV